MGWMFEIVVGLVVLRYACVVGKDKRNYEGQGAR